MKLTTPPSSAEVKNEWTYTATPPYACMVCTGTVLPLPLSVLNQPQCHEVMTGETPLCGNLLKILCTMGMCECAGMMQLITNKLQRHGKQLVRGCLYRDIILSNTMQHSVLNNVACDHR